MAEIKMDLAKELESRGDYAFEGTWYGGPYARVERLNPPITPRENFLRYYRGEDFEWVPDPVADQVDLTPHCIPDVDACDYEGGYDTFGVKWIPVEGGMLPSFVEPGFVVLEDIADWENMPWPDVDSWPWAEYAAKYNETLKGDDRLRRGVILSAYFERLIAIMSFEEAAMALLTDPESVEAYFNKLTELNIAIMRHYIDDFGCEAIMIHDDWAAQRAPFFSLEVTRKLLVPQVKKMVEYAHSRNVIFTLHSCGNGEMLIPAMIETGADGWQAQFDALNFDSSYEACGDQIILETYPDIPAELTGDALEAHLRHWSEKLSAKHRGLFVVYEYDPDRALEIRRLLYKIGREMAVEGRAK